MKQQTYLKSSPYNSPNAAAEEAKLLCDIISLGGTINVHIFRKKTLFQPKEMVTFGVPQEVRLLDEAIKIGVIKLFPEILNDRKFYDVNSMHHICDFLWKRGGYSVSARIPSDDGPYFLDVGHLAAIGEPKRYLTAYSELKEAFELAVEQGRIPNPERTNISAKESGHLLPNEAVESISKTDVRNWGSLARNDPCPCGSGRKFKHCHGAH